MLISQDRSVNKIYKNLNEIKINRSLLSTLLILILELFIYICSSTITLTRVTTFIFIRARASEITFYILILTSVILIIAFLLSVFKLNSYLKASEHPLITITPINKTVSLGLLLLLTISILLFKNDATYFFLWVFPCIYFVYIVKNIFNNEAWLLLSLNSAFIVVLVYLSKAFDVSVFVPNQAGVFIFSPFIIAIIFAVIGAVLTITSILMMKNKGRLGKRHIISENSWFLGFILSSAIFTAFLTTILVLGIRPLLYAIIGFFVLSVFYIIIYLYRSARN